MVLNRGFLSSRPFVGVFLLIAVALLGLWNYLIQLNSFVLFPVGVIFISPVVAWSFYEFFRLVKKDLDTGFWISLFTITFISIFPSFFVVFCGWKTSIVVMILSFCLLNLVAYLLGKSWSISLIRARSFHCLSVGGFLFWNSLFAMLLIPSYWMVIVFVLGMLNDSLAYFFGKVFGRKKLSKYSPNKTEEGFLISLFALTVIVTIGLIVLPVNLRDLIFKKPEYSWIFIPVVFLGLILGSLGDLWFSLHKRIHKIKDYSGILGAHGGFWDRFDSHCFSLTFSAIVFFIWSFLVA